MFQSIGVHKVILVFTFTVRVVRVVRAVSRRWVDRNRSQSISKNSVNGQIRV